MTEKLAKDKTLQVWKAKPKPTYSKAIVSRYVHTYGLALTRQATAVKEREKGREWRAFLQLALRGETIPKPNKVKPLRAVLAQIRGMIVSAPLKMRAEKEQSSRRDLAVDRCDDQLADLFARAGIEKMEKVARKSL